MSCVASLKEEHLFKVLVGALDGGFLETLICVSLNEDFMESFLQVRSAKSKPVMLVNPSFA